MGDSDDGSPLCISEATKKAICDEVISNLVDDAILGICFEAHRLMKAGVFPDDPQIGENAYKIVDKAGYDIFGNEIHDNCEKHYCYCSNCSTELSCKTFGRHFQKCKEGRRRTQKNSSYVNIDNGRGDNDDVKETDEEDNEDENDLDFNSRRPKKNSRKTKGKAARGKKKASSKPK